MLENDERQELGRLFEAYGKALLDDQRSEIWNHIADGGINVTGAILLFFDSAFTLGAVTTSIGLASFVRNRLAGWAWKDRKRQLRQFDEWIAQLADSR